ncbi:MAG: sigma-54-dependent Fis family transcriptional regulator [Xanthomonadales bacterium]|nr:sigma-54-dependent Fis family transcriptional regulator [Xanthomonadales bacterium]
MTQASILVVDDEQDIRALVCEILEDEGYRVSSARDGESARQAFSANPPDLVLLDIWMPDIDGISLLKEWSDSGRLNCPVVMISGHGTLETAVEATRLGAHDFVQKPLSLAKLLATVKQALSAGAAAQQPPSTARSARAPLGNSPDMQLLRRAGQQAAASSGAILISGEHGTGKEALAAWLHDQSGNTGGFHVLDRTRLAGSDAEVYLLGKEQSEGALGAAGAGTLYLPELQDLAPDTQKLIAAALESGRFTASGHGSQPLACRLIVGLSGTVEQATEDAQVTPALMLQLGGLPLHLPALRDRPQDIPELANHYLERLSADEGTAYRHIATAALNRLRNHDWPGNERELENLIKRLLVLGAEGEISVDEVDELLRQGGSDAIPAGVTVRPSSFDLPLREAREAFERDYLTYQLRKAGGSVGKLATAVGMERTHLYRKLRSLGIDPKKVGGG